MKKKVVSMLLASTLILSAMLTGCGNAPADDGSTPASGSGNENENSQTGGHLTRIAIRAATARVPPRW